MEFILKKMVIVCDNVKLMRNRAAVKKENNVLIPGSGTPLAGLLQGCPLQNKTKFLAATTTSVINHCLVISFKKPGPTIKKISYHWSAFGIHKLDFLGEVTGPYWLRSIRLITLLEAVRGSEGAVPTAFTCQKTEKLITKSYGFNPQSGCCFHIEINHLGSNKMPYPTWEICLKVTIINS